MLIDGEPSTGMPLLEKKLSTRVDKISMAVIMLPELDL